MTRARVRVRTTARAVVFAVVMLLAQSAHAWALCPNCLGQTRALGPTLRLLGAFLLVPFLVFYLAARRIRRACRTAPRER